MADDVVAELDTHIHDAEHSTDYAIEWRRTLLIGLLQRARDEIVALRSARNECERQFQEQVAEVSRLLCQLEISGKATSPCCRSS